MSHPDSNPSQNSSGSRTVQAKEDYSEMSSPSPAEPSMESLGEALAGVHLSSTGTPSGFGSSAINSGAFAIGSRDHNGWGNFASPTSTKIPEESSVDAHVRNESLELFLSQSPSQTLGEDVFRFSHTNLPSLAEERHSNDDEVFHMPSVKPMVSGSTSQHVFGDLRSQETSRRRVESPSCSVTGTTTSSRSVSPYATNGDISARGSISAYQRYETPEAYRNKFSPFGDNEHRSNSNYNNISNNSTNNFQGLQPHVTQGTYRSPYASKERSHSKNLSSPYDQINYDRSSVYNNQELQGAHSPQMQLQLGSQLQQQQQVLYMPVPSPDGNGQLLQPVQMMQMPGKPYTFVIPVNANMQGLVDGIDHSRSLGISQGLNHNAPEYGSLAITNVVSRDGRSRYGGIEDSPGAMSYNSEPSYSLHGGNRMGLSVFDDVKEMNLAQDLSINPYTSDPSIASLYAAPQRPPLEALLGQVRRLSRDQVGCRLVQQALDEEGPMAATLILNEGLPFWGEAMVDPFGNYLFQKIIEKITAEERILLVKSVSTRLVNASLNLHGTRSVQKVVELCAQDEIDGHNGSQGGESAAIVLTNSLAPAAARLCIDSHGNHVIQRILLRLSPIHSQFVFDAVAASVGDVARHRHGCCVIQRCLDSPPSNARAHLVRRIVEKSLELMQDAYGNYVVQYVLDVCSDEDVHAVCESVVGKVNLLAIQKFSSNVMEKCLERCSDRVKEMYLHEMSDPERIRELMMDPFGNYVVQRALSVATHTQAIRLVEAMRPHFIASQASGPGGQRNGGVRNTAGGRRIIAKICRRFPNFTLNPGGSQEELFSQNKANNHRYLNHQQQGHPAHNIHKQSSMLATYAPLAAQPHIQPHYGTDPRLIQSLIPVQQQQQHTHSSPYGGGLASGNPYYDPFSTDGLGGYPGM